jgi:ACS family pantothenate transporter-like MFS transporter
VSSVELIRFCRPCYIGLKNNVSTRLLETTLNRFPAGTEDFVSHKVLGDYIQETAAKTSVDEITQYDTEVRKVTKTGEKWIVETTTLHTDESGKLSKANRSSVGSIIISQYCDQNFDSKQQEFDAVVVASGHYHAAKVPNISGLVEWKQKWPQRVQHSKGYRKPEEFQGKVCKS